MNTVPVPEALRSPFHSYPPHEDGVGLERGFYDYTRDHAISTSASYVPIHWTNNYHRQSHNRKSCVLEPLDSAQRLLRRLDKYGQYFTVVQCDDGIYEDTPANLFVFGAGGTGDEPIPLLSTPHPTQSPHKRVLASFQGNIETGGPDRQCGPLKHSSWDNNGAGARIRRAMQAAFHGQPGCVINASQGSDKRAIESFRKMAETSWFGLSPRGYGKTSFRLYEMLSLGTVPVYIFDEPWVPFANQIAWESFCVLCPESEIASLPQRLAATTLSWRASAIAAGRKALDDLFTLHSTCRQIHRIIEERWPCVY